MDLSDRNKKHALKRSLGDRKRKRARISLGQAPSKITKKSDRDVFLGLLLGAIIHGVAYGFLTIMAPHFSWAQTMLSFIGLCQVFYMLPILTIVGIRHSSASFNTGMVLSMFVVFMVSANSGIGTFCGKLA